VQRNKGSPGMDGLTVKELAAYLRNHWRTIREQLLVGRYQPSACPGPGVTAVRR
jgi:RNA-directed DNA polymerase